MLPRRLSVPPARSLTPPNTTSFACVPSVLMPCLCWSPESALGFARMRRERRFAQAPRACCSFVTRECALEYIVSEYLDYSSVPTIRGCSSALRSLAFKSFAHESLRSATAYSYIMERASYVLVDQRSIPETPHWQLSQEQATQLGISGGCMVWHVELRVEHSRPPAYDGEDPRDRDEDLGDRLQLWVDERGRLTNHQRIVETFILSLKVKMRLEPHLEKRFLKSAEENMDLMVHDQRNALRWGGEPRGPGIYAHLPPIQPDNPLLGVFLDGLGYQMTAGINLALEQVLELLSQSDWKDLPSRSYELPPASVLLTESGMPRLLQE